MPKQFDENTAEAELVAAREEKPATVAQEPKATKKAPEPDVPDIALYLILTQRIVAKGLAIGRLTYNMTASDDTSEYTVVKTWEEGEIIVEDTAHDTRRAQINYQLQHAQGTAHALRQKMDAATAQAESILAHKDRKVASDEQMGITTDPNFIAASEVNADNAYAEAARLKPMVQKFEREAEQCAEALRALPPRVRWTCPVDGPMDIKRVILKGNERE